MNERRSRQRYKPGQIVEKTGIYKVYHNQHRLMHQAALMEQTCFPRCRICKDQVRFVLQRIVEAKYVLPFRSTELLEEWEESSGRAS